MAEAYLGIGDRDRSEEALKRAQMEAPAMWMVESTRQQLEKLTELLSRSPLHKLPGVSLS